MTAHAIGELSLSYDPAHSRRFIWPRAVEPLGLRMLLLGLSHEEASALAVSNPVCDVLHIVASTSPAGQSEKTPENLETRVLSLRNVRRLKENFDFIVCHHDRLKDDSIGNLCDWLSGLLPPHGVVCLRVYSTAYRTVSALQQSLLNLAWHDSAEARKRVEVLYNALPSGHVVRTYVEADPANAQELLFDMFFGQSRTSCSVGELLDEIKKSPLHFHKWVEPSLYRLDTWLPVSHPLIGAVVDCDPADQAALCDAIMQNRPWHQVLLCHKDQHAALFSLSVQDEDFFSWIPTLRGTVRTLCPARPGGACVVARRNLQFEVDYFEAKCLELMNGRRTIDDILAELDGVGSYHERSRRLRQLLHRLHTAGHIQCSVPCKRKKGAPLEPLSAERTENLLAAAFEVFQKGDRELADALYSAVLERNPGTTRAAYNLGVLSVREGRYNQAYDLLKLALENDPAQRNHWFSFIELLLRSGKALSAADILSQGVSRGLHGDEVDALSSRIQKDIAAHSAARELLKQFADQPVDIWKEEAVHCLQLHEDNPHVVYTYARLLLSAEAVKADDPASIALMEQLAEASQKSPCHADILNAYGLVLKRCGQHQKAHGVLKQILQILPDNADVLFNVAGNLSKQGRNSEAITYLRTALKANPDGLDIKVTLATLLFNEKKHHEAEQFIQELLLVKESFPENIAENVNQLHGALLLRNGHTQEGIAIYADLFAQNPASAKYALRAKLQLPVILDREQSIDVLRADFLRNIRELTVLSFPLVETTDNVGWPPFYLAYHNRDDRPIMEALAEMYTHLMPELKHVNPSLSDSRNRLGKKIKVGFISGLLHAHTMGKLNQGFIRHLDRGQFEVVIIRLYNAPQDEFSRIIDSFADAVVHLPEDLPGSHHALDSLQLDILYFTDIGMTPDSYFLAHGRYAPVQTVTWGHPDTTGLKTIDYFLSCDLFEAPGAEQFYTEKLIRFPRASSCYQPVIIPAELGSKSVFGLPEGKTLYGCLQTLFKMHPDFDQILYDIVKNDPDGILVFIEGTNPDWIRHLKKRWQCTHPLLLERSIFLPSMNLNKFMQLNAHMDVLLEPIHFGGGNTFYEAMAFGTPYVIWPGKFMRGRVMYGMYKQMGMLDVDAVVRAPVVDKLEDYAPMAVKLGKDPALCRSIREHSAQAARQRLYNDLQAVRQLETFFVEAVKAAEQGELLPSSWSPVLEAAPYEDA